MKEARGVEAWIGGLEEAFSANADYWRAVGEETPSVCQFELSGETPRTFFCEVDARGARIHEGLHAAPQVQWSSSTQGFMAALGGMTTPDIRIEGDIASLQSLLASLAKVIPANPPVNA